MYDPEIVDAFLGMLDQLEAIDSVEEHPPVVAPAASATPIEAIKAAVREQRDYEATRTSVGGAAPRVAQALLTHFRTVAPVETVVLFQLKPGTHDLIVSSAAGTHAAEIAGLQIAVGEGIAGWVYAHKQAVLNSEAALDFGALANRPPAELRYAIVVPVGGPDGHVAVAIYGPERFTESHRQLFEFASGLVPLGLTAWTSPPAAIPSAARS